MFVETLEQLQILANKKMSVCQLHGKIFSKDFIPASVLFNMPGSVIQKQFKNMLIIYKPKRKK